MNKDVFINTVSNLLPKCKADAIPHWIEFATECVNSEQHVDFIPEKDKSVAIGRWLNSIYAGLYFVKKEFGDDIASQICNLSLDGCLYPDQMKPAAEYLQRGGDLNKAAELAVDGAFDGPPPYFPRLDDVMEDMTNGSYKFLLDSSGDMVERIITADIPNCIRQFAELEEALQGQMGLYGEWVRFSYETCDVYEVTPAEFAQTMCNSFKQANDKYGVDIARALYSVIKDGALLPSEIIRAAEYLHNGGRIEDVPEKANNGAFESHLSMDSLA